MNEKKKFRNSILKTIIGLGLIMLPATILVVYSLMEAGLTNLLPTF